MNMLKIYPRLPLYEKRRLCSVFKGFYKEFRGKSEIENWPEILFADVDSVITKIQEHVSLWGSSEWKDTYGGGAVDETLLALVEKIKFIRTELEEEGDAEKHVGVS